MDPKLLSALRELLIAALPTLVLFLLVYFYLKTLFFPRLEKVLEERRQATSGTRKAADESLKRAEAKAAEYEEKLRAARSEIYKEQEAVRKQWRDEQAAAMAASREQSDVLLRDAKASLAAKTAEAKASLGRESESLAEQIAASILTGRKTWWN